MPHKKMDQPIINLETEQPKGLNHEVLDDDDDDNDDDDDDDDDNDDIYFKWKHFFPLLILTQSVVFWYNDFHITLYFVN